MRLAIALVAFVAARDAPAAIAREPRAADETQSAAAARPARVSSWATALDPIDFVNLTTRARAAIRLYGGDGAVDDDARAAFEQVAASPMDAAATRVRPLAVRLEQLVVKAAYHFQRARVLVVSGFRANAGRHGTGDALDFKLEGISASRLAAYLRAFPRAGVGVYTHPRTQFVHLDVRESSYHWLDASPPGVKWREAMLRDPSAEKRDAAWTPDMDEPCYDARALSPIARARNK
jgi:uncharacterized protein YcbK (DUF882 family)